ncbi:NUDIX hydrolase [Polaribacter porphyrae]|uniref:NUDIX hydrolase n=1 Tax=Polaribacter porphyrae TaxID=1137780 RepID=A0A2S7WUA8_9FLAO|nr:NUDIX domain-containing protein [Polaribacter porphyrae]PQJ80911.1 NUDIX hydrolase [Polaribacter porphyrae]
MYKVFVNDKPIIITSSSQNKNNYPVYIYKNIVFDEVIYKLKNEAIQGILLYTTNLEKDWNRFKTNFKVVPAAGGLVKNSKNEFLFIFRNDIWDLPKGRIEKGETIDIAAIREVEEECGIFNLSILKKLITTYHTYYQKGLRLKETHWFLMTSNYNKPLIPQIEEGITEATFKNESEIKAILEKSYANIKLVYDTYKEA